MKKLLGISVIAMLAVAPAFAANGDPVPGAPTAYSGNDATTVTATVEPEFALVGSDSATDNNAASAGYVKGAYNAAIKAINKVNANTKTAAGAGLTKSGNKISVDLTSTGGLQTSGSGDDATLEIKAGDGIKTDANGVAVDLTSKSGLEISSNQLQVKAGNGTQIEQTNGTLEVKAGNGVGVDANGVKVVAKDGAIVVDGSGVTVGLTNNGGIVKNATNNTLELKVDGSTVEVDSTNGVQVKDGGITVAKIATSDIAAGTGTYASSTDLANQGYVDQAIAGLNIGDYATKTGVDNTIKGVDITVTDQKTVSLTGDVVATGSGTLTVMTDWTDPTQTATHSYIGGISNTLGAQLGGTITAAIDDNSVSYTTANQ